MTPALITTSILALILAVTTVLALRARNREVRENIQLRIRLSNSQDLAEKYRRLADKLHQQHTPTPRGKSAADLIKKIQAGIVHVTPPADRTDRGSSTITPSRINRGPATYRNNQAPDTTRPSAYDDSGNYLGSAALGAMLVSGAWSAPSEPSSTSDTSFTSTPDPSPSPSYDSGSSGSFDSGSSGSFDSGSSFSGGDSGSF